VLLLIVSIGKDFNLERIGAVGSFKKLNALDFACQTSVNSSQSRHLEDSRLGGAENFCGTDLQSHAENTTTLANSTRRSSLACLRREAQAAADFYSVAV